MLKLVLKDFMCHKSLVLEFTEPVGFIVGANGVGKTAIRDALEMVYLGTGKIRGISTKKALGELSVREGAKSCSVTVETEKLRIERTMKRDGSQEFWMTQGVETASGIEFGEPRQVPPRRDGKSQVGGIADDALRVVLEPTEFFRLDEARRRELVLKATSQKATLAEIVQALHDCLEPEGEEDKKAIQDAAEFVVEFGMRPAETHAAEVRARAKRDLKDVTPERPTHAEGLAPELCEVIEARTLEELETRLEEVRTLHTQAVAREASSTGVIEGQLQEAQAAQAAAEAVEYEPADKGAKKGLVEATKRVAAATGQVESIRKSLDTARQVFEETEVAVSEIDYETFVKPKACPAVPFPFQCTVKKGSFRAAIEAGNGQADDPGALGTAKKAADELKVKLDAAVQALEAVQAQLATATERAETERDRTTRDDAKAEAINRTRARAQELEGQLLEAQTMESGIVGETAPALEERVERGREMVEAKRAWDIQEDLYRNQTTRKTELEMTIARWDEIAKALKPDGIETMLGGGAKEEFLELLDSAEGLAGSIELTPDFDIVVHRGVDVNRHPLQLSTSQRLAVGIAIQHAFATLLQFPILCCDAIDTFDQGLKSAWAEFANRVEDRYDGAILGISTTSVATPAAPPPGFESYHLHDGTATHLITAEE